MSEEKYIPKSKLGQWFDSRLPLLTLGESFKRLPNTKKFKLLVDVWRNTNILFNYSNYNRYNSCYALCGSHRFMHLKVLNT